MILDELIQRLQSIRDEHGGQLLCVWPMPDSETGAHEIGEMAPDYIHLGWMDKNLILHKKPQNPLTDELVLVIE